MFIKRMLWMYRLFLICKWIKPIKLLCIWWKMWTSKHWLVVWLFINKPMLSTTGNNGGDFGIGNHDPGWSVSKYDTYRGWCHCWQHATSPTSAPLIGSSAYQSLRSCWIRCGCWTVPYGHGGMSALTTYCGSGHCGQGGTGGGGLVKITYF